MSKMLLLNANCADPAQTAPQTAPVEQSDLGLHCLLRNLCPNVLAIMVLCVCFIQSLRNTDQNLEPTCEADDLQKVVELLTDTDQGPSADLFFIDKRGAASAFEVRE